MSDPTTCPVCRCAPCAYPHVCRYAEDLAGVVVEHKNRLAAVEARLPVVRMCEPWCGGATSPGTGSEFQCDMDGESRYFCTAGCRFVAGIRTNAPPPSAEPTTATFEQLVERAGPVSPALPLVVPGVQHSTNVRVDMEPAPVLANSPVCQPKAPLSTSPAFVNQPAPVASGASVPDGFVLGEGWRVAERDWACTPFRGSCLSAGAAYETTTTEDGPMCGVGACATHAVEMGALVKVEPPKAETAQAGEATPFDRTLAQAKEAIGHIGTTRTGPLVREGARSYEQPAEPSAPVGFRVVGRSGPGVERNYWVCLARDQHGGTLTKPRLVVLAGGMPAPAWDAGCYDLLEPIAEPVAPPVAEPIPLKGLTVSEAAERYAAPPVAVRRSPFAAVLADAVPGDDGVEARLRAATDAAVAGRATRPFPPVAACLYPDRCGKRWLRNDVLCDGDDGTPPWRCPNCAPPVAAKLSETMHSDRIVLRDVLLRIPGGLGGRETAALARFEWHEAEVAALETALDVRIADLEASHRKNVDRAVREDRKLLAAAIREEFAAPGLSGSPTYDQAFAELEPRVIARILDLDF